MFVLWSKQEYNGKYILFCKNTLEELNESFTQLHKNNIDEYEINPVLNEKELDSFSLYENDYEFYFSNIPNVDANQTIYIFTFTENGEGQSYYNEIYFVLSNNKDYLLKTATEFFTDSSEKKEVIHIKRMLKSLKTIGNYSIPHGITYVCDMEIFIFTPYQLK
jgi:hypothetical protein